MAYPDDIDTFREIENLPGLNYDVNDKKTFFTEDLQAVRDSITAIEGYVGTNDDITTSALYLLIASSLYPVGRIVEFSTDYDPNVSMGFGTWELYGVGRVTVGQDTGESIFDTLNETGGAITHTLTTAEMPAHTHGVHFLANSGEPGASRETVAGSGTTTGTTSTGGGGAHNNVQPYIVVARWVRTV